MKRKLVAAIVGMAASLSLVGSAHAQGRVFFATYNITTDARINYGPGTAGAVGTPVNTSFTAGLWYFLGTATLAAGTGTDTLPTGWEVASVTSPVVSNPAGYVNGPVANISDYTSGPITFAITAYNGSAYGSANTTAQGHSAGFTLPSIATGTSGTGEFGPGAQAFSVLPVPEPSILALSGLGAAALMLIRRKK
jgi:PEP-CTERM motif-containing protein